jgi:hypothetical protein
MSQYFDTPTRPDIAAGAIGVNLRVKTPGALVVAGASDVSIGTMETTCTQAGPCAVRLRTAQGTRKMVAAGVISAASAVYAAASGKIAATGSVFEGISMEAAGADGDVIEVLSMPNVDITAASLANNVKQIRTRLTIAQVNAGHTILPAVVGYKYRVVDLALIAVGGAATGATGVLVRGTQSASVVKLMDAKVAGLTQSNLLRIGTATNGVILADGASFVANDANTAITVIKDGNDVATATHIDVLLTYAVDPA